MKSKVVFKKDVLQTQSLIKAGKVSAKNALRASKALGLTVTYIKDGVICKEYANGVIEKTTQIETEKKPPFPLVKGMLLHAK